MEKNNEILDTFGKIIVKSVFDDNYKYFINVLNGTTKWGTSKEFTELFSKFNLEEKELLKKYIQNTFGTMIFSFLGIFEEQDEFKLIFRENGVDIDLVTLSDMLKSEAGWENGWINRFSQELKKEKES